MRVPKLFLATVTLTLPMSYSTAALADHGKAGLWSVDMSIVGQDTSQLSPEVTSQMKAKGLIPNARGGFTLQRCMTQAEVEDDNNIINAHASKDCQIVNQGRDGQLFSADLVCKGQLNGTGHVDVRYDSDVHYESRLVITAVEPEGKSMKQDQTFEGRWISPICPAQK